MKKLILAAIIALTAAACTKEDTTVTNNSNVTAVEFNISLADRASRAFAKAESVDCLRYNIFLAGEESAILSGSEQIDTDGEFHFSLNLAKGVEYDIIFWAQDASCTAYTLTGKSVTIDYTAISANDDAADAFFGSASSFNPSEDSSTFTLKRPFAQLNAATKDYQAIADLGAVSMTSTVSLKAHNKFNIATGDVFGDKVDVAFTATAIPAETFHISGYKYLLMNYILAPKAASTLTNTTFTFIGKRADNSTINIPSQTYTSIPLQQNCRTNILGSLLTNPTDFTVKLDSNFSSTEHEREVVPANQFWYTTTSGSLPFDQFDLFDKEFVSQSYNTEKGRWEATFNGAITEVYGLSDFDIDPTELALRSSITSIQLPEGVQTIGSGAFALTSISEITIPQSVTSIGDAAISGCSQLRAVYGKYASADNRCLVDGGKLISPAFAGLTEYTLPDEVTTIGMISFAFYAQSATKITIPDSVLYIYPMAFFNSLSLQEVVIGSGITALEADTFSLSQALTTVTINGSLLYSGSDILGTFKHAFDNCPSLTTFNGPQASQDHTCLIINKELAEIALATISGEYAIQAGIESVADKTFSYSKNITKITFGNDVKHIGSEVFFGSEGLKEVVIGDNVEVIENSAFDECNSIETVTIGPKVKRIGQHAFFANTGNSHYTPIKRVNISDLSAWCNIEFVNIDSNPLYEGYATLYLNGSKIEGAMTIPSDVTALKDYAFYNYDAITSVAIPDSVTSIGQCVFTLCSNLESFSGKFVPASDNRAVIYNDTLVAFAGKNITQYTTPAVPTIQQYVFSGCALTEVTLHDSVITLENNAFDSCPNLAKVTLSKNLATIGNFAFFNSNNLHDLYCRNSTPATLGSTIFGSVPDIWVPTGSLDDYKTAWSAYHNQVTHNIQEYTVVY